MDELYKYYSPTSELYTSPNRSLYLGGAYKELEEFKYIKDEINPIITSMFGL